LQFYAVAFINFVKIRGKAEEWICGGEEGSGMSGDLSISQL